MKNKASILTGQTARARQRYAVGVACAVSVRAAAPFFASVGARAAFRFILRFRASVALPAPTGGVDVSVRVDVPERVFKNHTTL